MITRQNLENKIKGLGGVKPNPLCPSVDKQIDDVNNFEELEKKFSCKLPEFYKQLYKSYGPFAFNEKIKCLDIQSNLTVYVDYFYSIDPKTKCSIHALLESHSDLVTQNLFPISDGELGDLICIALDVKNYGKIFYWYHERNDGDNLVLLAESLEQFIMKLEIEKEDSINEDIDKIKVKATPEFLEMLRKSGYGPKK
jgi:hypothetical protein